MTVANEAGRVDVRGEPAGALGEWRGVIYVDGVAEFRTYHTFNSQEAAEKGARYLLPQAQELADENAAALARCSGGAS